MTVTNKNKNIYHMNIDIAAFFKYFVIRAYHLDMNIDNWCFTCDKNSTKNSVSIIKNLTRNFQILQR